MLRGGLEVNVGMGWKGSPHTLPSVSTVFVPSRSTLARCCNAPSFLFTTQKNTPAETNLRYEVESSGLYHIDQEIFKMFPKVHTSLTWSRRSGWSVAVPQICILCTLHAAALVLFNQSSSAH